jgi:hypothetical protein
VDTPGSSHEARCDSVIQQFAVDQAPSTKHRHKTSTSINTNTPSRPATEHAPPPHATPSTIGWHQGTLQRPSTIDADIAVANSDRA